MADSIVRLRVDSQEYDNKLKRASEGLNRYIEGCRKAGGTLEHVDDGVKEFTQQLGKMETVAGGAKGKLGEMTKAFTDLTMQFNAMTEAEKRGQFGKALSAGLDELKQRIISTKQQLADINSSLNGGSGGGGLFGGDKLSGMLQVFGGNVMTKIAGAGLGLAGELKDMVTQGIELARQGEGIRIAFERLGRGDLLDGLRQATHGTVTDLELMKAAVKFNDFKLPVEELGTMLAFAQQKAKDTGQSVDYMVDSIVTGLGRKSLMILDNLGLSAAEIKDKMKETGDMTKAVGEIIREQMSKAGDYVETAADRATKANVELENAMTRLGETFQPLATAADSLWNDLKVGALDLLNTVVQPLINKFTELGRMRAVYQGQSGDARVNRQLDRLRGIQTDNYRQGTYKAQLRNYDASIASHEQYLKDYKAWQRDNTNVGAYDRMQAFKQQTGLEWVSDVKAHLEAFKKMRAEYVQGAKAILAGNPAPSPTTTTITPPGGTPKPTAPTDPYAGMFQGGAASVTGLSVGMISGDPRKSMEMGWGLDWQTRQKYNEKTDIAEYKRQQKEEREKEKDKDKKNDKTVIGQFEQMNQGIQGIFGGIEQMGIKLPEGMKEITAGISGMLSVVDGIYTVVLAIKGFQEVGAFLGIFARGGIVPHAQNGLSVVGGTHYSGDVTPILANAGEVVLNHAQVNNLAHNLQGGGMQNMHLEATVTGDQIRLALKNTDRLRGGGMNVTFK